ncbi:MAG: hypothetical protein CMK46_00700 [Porticoccus sp.]|nr:hypothetical protein [Porticoccus sp.]|tara:strand:+ start:15995 stop:16297 length:303 start_codon:yes stop_codon:yes gene_type:complete
MFKVYGMIRQHDEDGECTDEYEKTVFLPFAPFEGLYVSELHRRNKITSVFYSIEDEAFTVLLEDIREETFSYAVNRQPDRHSKETFKRLLLNEGWVRSFC